MNIIDSHAHFDPRMLDLPALLRRMDRHGIARVALIPCMNDPLPHTPERLLSGLRVLMQRRLSRPLANLVHRATLTSAGDLRLLGEGGRFIEGGTRIGYGARAISAGGFRCRSALANSKDAASVIRRWARMQVSTSCSSRRCAA